MSRNRTALALPLLLLAACADPGGPASTEFAPASALVNSPAAIGGPVFDLDSSPDGSLLAGQLFNGIVELRKGAVSNVAALAGVTGIAAIGRGDMLAITGGGFDPALDASARRLYRVSRGNTTVIADLGAFEAAVNPDGGNIDSNPFNIARLNGGDVLVADAAANAIVRVSNSGAVDWVAVLTGQLASTQWLKDFVHCPNPAPFCSLPAALPAEPVSTSIAVGPDGNYYAGELTGFPGTPGISRIWRITAGSRHVICPSASCTVAVNGLTAIVDIEFGPDGRLYVVELDAASWLATEIVGGPVAGGTVKACNVATGSCALLASGLSLPTAIAFASDGTPWVVENTATSAPGTSTIRPLF